MIDALFSQSNYVTAKKMLDATVLRHEAIASNLANRAAASQDPGQIAALAPRLAADPSAVPVRPDGNTVQLENELLAMNENSLRHALQTQLLTGSLLKLRLAITGRSS